MKMKNVKHILKVPDNTCFVLNINSVGSWKKFSGNAIQDNKIELGY